MDDYLTKPIDRARLGSMLEKWLGSADSEDSAKANVIASTGGL